MLVSSAAAAGPPFLTDDPEPTDTGHWEIYAPFFEAEGSGRDFGGSLGAEINYGAAKDLQLTVGLPAGYSHDRRGWHWSAGDLELRPNIASTTTRRPDCRSPFSPASRSPPPAMAAERTA